ncbi:Polyketide cyclase/dehydrase [Segniliparus rotundus DSM 44985]|uniref:Polyketide cyclase/dehydrase n=1 Tax=Segniliparus rotundus (strain ATCC BAA-972 / CDC 1076 / CIP 108378 / DSM 44985 / JCM 13578) TaxID=640132 RepID=D6ZDE1_SEGRD|nr:SRPBCC family protein [Segniliparus rotundus]ADG97205.1 Polyketide cyclase/dehydrase [Segniliparus rotundus DSM 44985]
MAYESDVVSVERVIDAEASDVFDLLADANRHKDFDGSGTVVGAKGASQRLFLGAKFGMSMRMGFSYSMVNTVVAFEPNREIAWQPRASGPLGLLVGGRIWRYEILPADNGVLVRETWDITHESVLTKRKVRQMARATERNMRQTLDRIADLLEKPTRA